MVAVPGSNSSKLWQTAPLGGRAGQRRATPSNKQTRVDLGTSSSRSDWATDVDDDADAGGSLVLDEVYSLMKCR